MSKKQPKVTPLMQQYNAIKAKYPNALLLFRVGDFYETFGADAIKAAGILGIVLTSRNNGSSKLELAGFPHHSMGTYLPKLVKAGERVAVCDQLEAPSKEKKIVKRGVTELITPGIALDDQILDQKQNNFLASLHFNKKIAGVAFLDISTGEFLTAEGPHEYINKLLHTFSPREIVFQRQKRGQFEDIFDIQSNTHVLDDWAFSDDFSHETILKHFKTNNLKGFGIDKMSFAINACGACLHYLSETEHKKISHINHISRIDPGNFVWLDQFTLRNLELIHSPNENGKTLVSVIDKTTSPMGARLLRRWISMPLINKKTIDERLNIVDYFHSNEEQLPEIKGFIQEIGDLERLISKVATGRICPRETNQLCGALKAIPKITTSLSQNKNKTVKEFAQKLHPLVEVAETIENTIHDEAPVIIGKGPSIAQGFNPELDELRNIIKGGKDALKNMQEREAELTGISSLKIGFNNVFGYYIEVRNTHKDKVPENWIRKQTLTNAERYITEELKEYEVKILGADEKILAIEQRLFIELVNYLTEFISPIQHNAGVIAKLDCLLGFATLAKENNYNKPIITEDHELIIQEGRHPVIEKQLPIGTSYISNSVTLNNDQQIIMITGPNMSGKSALLRQTAIIVLMAQIGCFVPANSAEIGIVDKIFTRVGASDNISQGESTFMVEMNETASILNNLSERSLVILDEIGRGTSTYDGISIAWAIAEYLHQHPKYKAKTLFATHYHELNEMTHDFHRIKNYHISVKEQNNSILFLRKLTPGGSAHSFGIHVAEMAGMPKSLLKRSKEMLNVLEAQKSKEPSIPLAAATESTDADYQLSFFQLDDPVLENIKEELIHIDINNLTPVDALMKLNEIKKLVGG